MDSGIFLSLAVSLLLTLAFEGAIALLWGLRTREQLRLVLLVNCLTNPPVVLAFQLLRYSFPGLPMAPVAVLLEVGAVLVEGFCYRFCRVGIRHPFLLSVAANDFSFFLGLLLQYVV